MREIRCGDSDREIMWCMAVWVCIYFSRPGLSAAENRLFKNGFKTPLNLKHLVHNRSTTWAWCCHSWFSSLLYNSYLTVYPFWLIPITHHWDLLCFNQFFGWHISALLSFNDSSKSSYPLKLDLMGNVDLTLAHWLNCVQNTSSEY